MNQEQPSVTLKVGCSAVGGDIANVPDDLTLTITSYVMEKLEQLIAYEQQARALFLRQFPDGKHDWCSVELMFDHFEPTCLLEGEGGEDEEDEDENDSSGSDMRIDCKCIRLHEDSVFLLANMRNEETAILSGEISHGDLRAKFDELRMLQRSIATQEAIAGAIDGGDAAVQASAPKSRGPSL